MNILASLENNLSFYSIADFFRSFYNVKRAKSFTSRGKIQRFVAPDLGKMISLQDSAAVYDVAPIKETICFSHRESSYSFSSCWTAKLDEIRKRNSKENNEQGPKK